MKREKRKKTLAAVSAVVAAGLTPGIIAASATGASVQGSNVEITAADVVTIAGTTYSFDELYAVQRGSTGDTIETHIELEPFTISTEYGAKVVPNNPKVNSNDDTVYHTVEQMPRFPGGERALKKYLKSHINYPPMAAENNVQGKVVVQFVVNKDGSVGEVKLVRSVDKDLDREAIRVVKSLPKFTPGRQNGEAVNVWYTLPVPFELKKDNVVY